MFIGAVPKSNCFQFCCIGESWDNFLKYQTGSGIFRHLLQLGTERVENLLLEDIMKFSLY